MKAVLDAIDDSPAETPVANSEDAASVAWLRDCLHAAFPVEGAPVFDFAWDGEATRIRQLAASALVAPLLPAPNGLRAVSRRGAPSAKIRGSRPPGKTPRGPKPQQSANDAERRDEERPTVSIYRTALLRWDGMESLCLIRNVSPGGMMIKLPARLAAGQEATVEMRSGQILSGQIAWAGEGVAGMQFDERINVAEVLNGAHREVASWTQRGPRLHVPCAVTLLAGNRPQNATLLDLSQGGAKLEADFLREGDDVVVAVRGLDPRRGIIRWTHDGRAGVAFHACIPFDTLAQWAVDRQH